MSWGAEALLLGGLYLCYSLVRNVAGGNAGVALANGERLLGWEQALGLDLETPLNALTDATAALAVGSAYFYAVFHFLVTPAVLIWLVLRRPDVYHRARTLLVTSTGIALVLFFLSPTAPPRLLGPDHGFVDVMRKTAGWGWWPAEQAASVSNQFAAMPSVHCLWALWAGYVLVRQARTRTVRALGVLYPPATVFVVLATGNHYLLDALAAVALGVAVLMFAGPLPSLIARPARELPVVSVGSGPGPDHR